MPVQFIKDQADKFRSHAVNSLAVRAGVERDPEIIRDVNRNPSVSDLHGLIRACMIQEGTPAGVVVNMGPDDLYAASQRMFNSVGTSDLPAILEDTINKAFTITPAEAGATFDQICKEERANDFREISFPDLSQFSGLDDLPEGAPFKHGSFSDSKETGSITTKGKMVTVTRQAITNNETDLLFSVPRRLTAATYARMNRDFYDLLLSNPVMNEDSKQLFHTDHKNIVTASGEVSVSAIDKAEQLLSGTALLKAHPADPDEFIFGGVRTLLAGTSQRLSTLQVINSTADASKNNSITYNPFTNAVKTVFDPYLQSKLTAAGAPSRFFCFADNMSFPNVVVIYLSGNKTPVVRSGKSGIGQAQGLNFEVYFDYGFAIRNWRGAIQCDGGV